MSTFWKKIIRVDRLEFFKDHAQAGGASIAPNVTENAGATIGYATKSPKQPGYGGNVITFKPGTRLGTSLGYNGKDQWEHLYTAANSAITVGVAVSGGITVLAAQALAAGATTNVAAGFTQPDVPRNINFVTNNAACGDGTFTSANAKIVNITGLNQFNETITESVALNGTTTVSTIQAFEAVLSILFPSQKAGGDTCTTTVGAKLALERPIQSSADFIEASRKASAATSYTVETLPATYDVGEAWNVLTNAQLPNLAAGLVTSVALTVNNTQYQGVAGAFPAAPFLLEIITGAGVEIVTVTAINTVSTTDTLTAIRGLNGNTGPLPAIFPGAFVNWRSGQTVSPALTANDRYRLRYRSGVE